MIRIRRPSEPPRKGAFWNLNRVRDSRARRARRREQQVWARRNEYLNARRAQEEAYQAELETAKEERDNLAEILTRNMEEARTERLDAGSTIGGMLVVAGLVGLATCFLFWVVEAFF